jgi:hypothetical protein
MQRSFGSTCHGAGRALSRSAAMRGLDSKQVRGLDSKQVNCCTLSDTWAGGRWRCCYSFSGNMILNVHVDTNFNNQLVQCVNAC